MNRCIFVTVCSILAILCGCKTEGIVAADDDLKGSGASAAEFEKVESGIYELKNDCFSMTCERCTNGSFRIVSLVNLRDDVTSVDLRRFGNGIFCYLIAPKLAAGERFNEEDEDLLYFSFDIWVGSVIDITTYIGISMRPDTDYSDVPDDFENEGVLLDVKGVDVTDARRMMSAKPRAELRSIRNLCAKNLRKSEMGEVVEKFGRGFWDIPLEVYRYQAARITGDIKRGEKNYLEPNWGNLWGLLRTNDSELDAYVVGDHVVEDRSNAERDMNTTFAEMRFMLDRIREALGKIDSKKTWDILKDVTEEFDQKDRELRNNAEILLVDMPVAIYAKIAMHEIDQAKSFFNDNEERMRIALRVFKERTEGGALVHRIRSKSAKETCDQLVKIARSELGAEADRILGL